MYWSFSFFLGAPTLPGLATTLPLPSNGDVDGFQEDLWVGGR